MEIITTLKSAEIFSIQEASQIGDVRRYAGYLAQELQFTDVEIANLSIVITEVGTNLIKHTPSGGNIIIQTLLNNQQAKIELLALDQGPGIANLNRCLQDGYSTAQTQGTGLGAMQRLADVFDIYSQPDQGTAIVAQFWHKSKVHREMSTSQVTFPTSVGTLSLAMPGETVCGDGWVMFNHQAQGMQTLLISDGLGHGLGAHEATQTAIDTFQTHRHQTILELLEVLHKALRYTRGAALAILQVNGAKNMLAFVGIGNIEGKLITPMKISTLLSQNGIVGHNYRKGQIHTYDLNSKFSLIIHSDGIKNRWNLANYSGLLAKHPSLIAAILYRDYFRGRDDATVWVMSR